jgi:hypothetical protein
MKEIDKDVKKVVGWDVSAINISGG